MSVGARAELEAVLQRLAQLLQQGAGEQAVAAAARARQEFPLSGELVRLHGLALLQTGRLREARAVLHRAAELAPGSIEVQCNLAQLMLEEGQCEAAVARLEAVLARVPDHPAVLQLLGMALMAATRTAEARDVFARALRTAPRHPGLHLHLAEAQLELGDNTDALAHAREAVALAPEADMAHAVLGYALRAQGEADAAAAAWLEAERLAPQQARHAYQAGLMLEEAGHVGQAASAYARALERTPESGPALSRLALARRRLGDWRDQAVLTARLHDALAAKRPGILPRALLFEPFDRTTQYRNAVRFAARIEEQLAPLRTRVAVAARRLPPGTPIRVGFVSDGFGDHAVGRRVVALVEALCAAPDGLDLHLFASSPDDGGAIRRRLAVAAPLHAIGTLPPTRVAARIHALGIEVLLDLTGYGVHTHADLFALRPAPVQAGWLAYPGTSGAPWMDYLLADRIVLPDSHRDAYSEKILRLPRCFMPMEAAVAPPPAPTRAACGLPDAGVVFACFNATAKLDPETFGRFMRILREVPDSVLWLRAGPEGVDGRLRAAAAAAQVAPQRLVFLPQLPHAQYRAHLARVDLYLDTLPYGAHAGAADALAAGCPLLTCAGATFAGRIAASVLSHAHLAELVAEDPESFVASAIRLGRDAEARRALRQAVSELARAPLFDVAGFAADFRRVLQTIGTRHRIGRPPIDLDF